MNSKSWSDIQLLGPVRNQDILLLCIGEISLPIVSVNDVSTWLPQNPGVAPMAAFICTEQGDLALVTSIRGYPV